MVIGLACGMGQWAMAVFVTAATWGLVYWLDSRISCRIRLRLGHKQDLKIIYDDVLGYLRNNNCHVKASSIYEAKYQLVYLAHVPSHLDPFGLEASLRALLARSASDAQIDVRMG